MTKWYDENIKKRGKTPQNNNIIIDDTGGDRPVERNCPHCGRTLVKLNDGDLWCNSCSSSYPQEETRTKSKLEVPRGRNTEVFAATTPDPNAQYMKKKEPQLKDGALALPRKGSIRFTSYIDSSAGKEGAD